MKDLFTIGEVSRLFAMNVRTLRYYDDIGLLKPAAVDEKTGYRYYSTREFERLNTIKYLRTLDMSLENIALFFENKEISMMKELLGRQKDQIQERIRELERIGTKIDNRLLLLEEAESVSKDQIVVREIEKRRVVRLRKEIAVTDDLELPLRELERLYDLEPIIFLGKVGVSIAREKLCRREYTSFSAVFVLVEPTDAQMAECGRTRREACFGDFIEAGTYLSICFRGTHTQAAAYYEKLLSYAEENQLTVCGDSVEITLVDAGLTNDASAYVTQLQIPVRRESFA
ncbi:MAG: MerR family transcriptional regulator [Roseburia sp.]|nr:MerR family transcriptional regulator [Ruminococcus sp.]MCM1155181.1 MerR family transcriptional regulator [Roseburia sp.]MCM1242645.1 MerR family transcriptional regulator [Roseburia sp.]